MLMQVSAGYCHPARMDLDFFNLPERAYLEGQNSKETLALAYYWKPFDSATAHREAVAIVLQ